VLDGRLRQAGLRVTKPRLAVLDVLSRAGAAHRHLSAADVAQQARRQLESLSTQAVYDCLDALTAAGLLRRIEPAGSPARYESRVADNHHHLVCRSCGVVTDVDCIVGSAPCLEPSDSFGFVVDEAEVVFWGLCPECSANSLTPSVPTPATEEIEVR
jgi:Fur family transcriptional regulator, stress-responsive regulator